MHTNPMRTPSRPTVVIVPGWRDSGPGHWQTLWANALPGAVRVVQDNWDAPLRQAWVERLCDTIEAIDGPVVLVAHSLGCITVAHLPERVHARIQAALLVAPANPERRAVLCDFAPVPYQPLPYPSIVVASNNDPFCPVRLAGGYARAWGSEFIRLNDAGHINVDSGHGPWPLGWSLLEFLLQGPHPGHQSASARVARPYKGAPSQGRHQVSVAQAVKP